MNRYKVAKTGIIQKVYKDKETFKEENPSIELKVGKVVNGYISENDLGKLILAGLENQGTSKNKEIFGLKIELKDAKSELEVLREEVQKVYSELEEEVGKYKELNNNHKKLTKESDKVGLKVKRVLVKIEEALQ